LDFAIKYTALVRFLGKDKKKSTQNYSH